MATRFEAFFCACSLLVNHSWGTNSSLSEVNNNQGLFYRVHHCGISAIQKILATKSMQLHHDDYFKST